MSKIYVVNLNILLSGKCNLQCKHCMRGKSCSDIMTEQTMDTVFSQIDYIHNLSICGGEPLLDVNQLRLLFESIKKNDILLGNYGMVSNGTMYTEEVETLLQEFEEYVDRYSSIFGHHENPRANCSIEMSWDIYHEEQLRKIKQNNPELYNYYLTNIKRLVSSKYFVNIRRLQGVFDMGNAKDLDIPKMPHEYMPLYYCMSKSGMTCGPMLTILPDGTVSECDGELEELIKEYNYGNVNNDSLEDIVKNHGKKCHSQFEYKLKHYRALKKYYL